MPRSPTVYNLPAATVPKVPLETISSAQWNAAMNDIAATFNTAQPIAYGGTGATTAIGGHDALNTRGTDIATAATLNLDTATGQFVDLTGTTTVTAVTLADGKTRLTRAASAFQITVGASLIGNNGGSNISVEAGDLIIWEGYAAGVVRFWLTRASGRALQSTTAKGYIFGLTLSNNVTDATNDIDIAAGEAASDGAVPVLLTLASALTKRIDAAWAVGTGNGGLMSAAALTNTTYHMYLIRRPDTGVVDAGFDVSATAPTLPANYTQYRRIGAVLRVSGAITPFLQDGDTFWRGAPIRDLAATSVGTSGVTTALSVPIGVKVTAVINGGGTNGSSSWYGLISSLDVADQAPSSSVNNFACFADTNSINNVFLNRIDVRTNTSAQVRYRATDSGVNNQFQILTLGWVDKRGAA